MKRFVIYLAVIAALCGCQGKRRGGAEVPEHRETLSYARGFTISHNNGYDVVTVRNPWDTLRTLRTYILIDRNAKEPAGLPEGTVIKVPVKKAVIYSSVHIAMTVELGAADAIAGVCEPQYIHSQEIQQRIKEGGIANLGSPFAPDTERIIDLDAEIIIASPFENAGYGAAEKIGIPIVEAADYMESHPLGRSEWIRFYGMLFGRESVADSLFKATGTNYNRLKEIASGAETRPSILPEKMYGPAWALPADDSYIAVMYRDAGAEYIFNGTGVRNGTPLAFEAVFDKACDADIWLFKYSAGSDFTLKSLKEENPLYAEFKAFREHRVYACNTDGLSYYDDITVHPDYILADFISIFHPELLPGHERLYYKEVK